MRGSHKSNAQILALLVLAAVPPPAHGADFSLALLRLGHGGCAIALCLLAAWLLAKSEGGAAA